MAHRTCARCGAGFDSEIRGYTCLACRRIASPSISLSPREQQVVALIRSGKPNKLIAYELCLTVGTVKEYLYKIFRKVGVSNRTELALWRGAEREKR